MEWVLKKHFILTLFAVLALVAAFFLVITIFSKSSRQPPGSAVLTKLSNSCPADYCSGWILGSCAGKKERYRERECYDYPERILTLSECEASKRIYYEKGAQADETC